MNSYRITPVAGHARKPPANLRRSRSSATREVVKRTRALHSRQTPSVSSDRTISLRKASSRTAPNPGCTGLVGQSCCTNDHPNGIRRTQVDSGGSNSGPNGSHWFASRVRKTEETSFGSRTEIRMVTRFGNTGNRGEKNPDPGVASEKRSQRASFGGVFRYPGWTSQ